MSSDFINRIGGRPSQLRETQPFGSRPTAKLDTALPQQDGSAPGALPLEGYSPTAAVGESPADQQAGEAQATKILAAWETSQAPQVSAGQLNIQGAENTTIHQVHGASGGQHISGLGPAPGFSGGTVYSSRPPH